MASMSEKSPAIAPTGTNSKDDLPLSAAVQASAGDDVARDLEKLQDRYLKTTNALASAAHDLKTPLAILNGYIELLQSQKLGPLNERQRNVMADMFSSGQRLQQFIQALIKRMPRRRRQLAVRDPDVLLLLPLLPRPHRHAPILRINSVDTAEVFVYESGLAPRAARVRWKP